MKTYNVGIAGFGWVAGAHLANLMALPNFKPVAIMDVKELDSVQIKNQYGCDVKVYNNYDEFLNDKDIDIVDICSPPNFHAEQTIKAANAVKDLIIEKPMALNYEDTKKMVKAVVIETLPKQLRDEVLKLKANNVDVQYLE